MHPKEILNNSENKYLILLESFFKEKWGETELRSHDLSHHRRVWNYATELLQYSLKEETVNESFTDKLIIACYLHDIGMSIDPEEKHGIHSRKLCEEFLYVNEMNPADFADLLQTIENHDNKEYTESTSDNKLLLHLSVADDLDALGYTGIYRYIEIYLARGIQPGEIICLVPENAERRFRNFENNFQNYPSLVEKHRSRFNILKEFFLNLDQELV